MEVSAKTKKDYGFVNKWVTRWEKQVDEQLGCPQLLAMARVWTKGASALDRNIDWHSMDTVAVMHTLLKLAFCTPWQGGLESPTQAGAALDLLNAFVRVILGKAFTFGLYLVGLENEGGPWPIPRQGAQDVPDVG